MEIGTRVRILRDKIIDRGEWGIGFTGTLIEAQPTVVAVKLDQHLELLDEWENAFIWTPEDLYDCNGNGEADMNFDGDLLHQLLITKAFAPLIGTRHLAADETYTVYAEDQQKAQIIRAMRDLLAVVGGDSWRDMPGFWPGLAQHRHVMPVISTDEWPLWIRDYLTVLQGGEEPRTAEQRQIDGASEYTTTDQRS